MRHSRERQHKKPRCGCTSACPARPSRQCTALLAPPHADHSLHPDCLITAPTKNGWNNGYARYSMQGVPPWPGGGAATIQCLLLIALIKIASSNITQCREYRPDEEEALLGEASPDPTRERQRDLAELRRRAWLEIGSTGTAAKGCWLPSRLLPAGASAGVGLRAGQRATAGPGIGRRHTPALLALQRAWARGPAACSALAPTLRHAHPAALLRCLSPAGWHAKTRPPRPLLRTRGRRSCWQRAPLIRWTSGARASWHS